MQSSRGFLIVASEVVALLAMTPFVYLEVCTVIEFGPSRWLGVWNTADVLTYTLQVSYLLPCAADVAQHLAPLRSLDIVMLPFSTCIA